MVPAMVVNDAELSYADRTPQNLTPMHVAIAFEFFWPSALRPVGARLRGPKSDWWMRRTGGQSKSNTETRARRNDFEAMVMLRWKHRLRRHRHQQRHPMSQLRHQRQLRHLLKRLQHQRVQRHRASGERPATTTRMSRLTSIGGSMWMHQAILRATLLPHQRSKESRRLIRV